MDYDLKQKDLAQLIGIKPGRLSAYIQGKEMPRVEVIIKLAEIGGLSVDDLLKSDKPPEKKEIVVSVGDNANNVAGVVYGTVYQNTTVRPIYQYTYQPGDLTEEQAAKLQQMVEEIVQMENTVKRAPKSYAAVWNAIKKKFKVGYYRKIRTEDFDKVQIYLKSWKGRLLRSKTVRKKDNNLYRKERYKSIFSIAIKELNWRKADVDNYIYAEYGKTSAKDLTDEQLDQLYGKIYKLKGKKS